MDATYIGLVVVGGSIANLLIGLMFVARVNRPDKARILGLSGTAMAVPLLLASVIAVAGARGTWDVVLPLGFVGFAIIEIWVDVISDFEVRTSRWLGPYLAAFYLGQWCVIGAAFRAVPLGGAVVLVSYFLCLAATVYSFRRVGHGVGEDTEVPRAPAQRP